MGRMRNVRPVGSVLVVVPVMGGVAMPVVDEVHVAIVLDGFVSAVTAVLVVMARVFDMGEWMLVVMAFVLAVGVPVMDVIHMSVVVDSDMATVGPVDVSVILMKGVFGCGHGVSFAWLTASATMCAT